MGYADPPFSEMSTVLKRMNNKFSFSELWLIVTYAPLNPPFLWIAWRSHPPWGLSPMNLLDLILLANWFSGTTFCIVPVFFTLLTH